MRIKPLVLMTAVNIFLCSCARTNNNSESCTYFGANISVCDDYAFRTDANDNKLYLWDLNSGEYSIYCSLPDCQHQTVTENKNTKCCAVAPEENYSCNYAFIYNDRLYSIFTGKLNEFVVYEADKDGQNRRQVYESDISICTFDFPVLSDGKFVFIGSEFDTQSIDTTENLFLCVLDFSDFTLEKKSQLGTTDETYILPQSMGVINNKIYFEHTENADGNAHTTFESIDISTNEKEQILENDGGNLCVWQYDGGNVIYNIATDNDTHSAVYSLDINNNESTLLFEMEGYASSIYKDDTKVFYMSTADANRNEIRTACVYNLDTKNTSQIEFDNDTYLYICGRTGKKHLIQYQNSDRNSFGILDNEDFWNLNFDKANFCFEQ